MTSDPFERIEHLESALETALDELVQADKLLNGERLPRGAADHFHSAMDAIEKGLDPTKGSSDDE